MCTDQNFGCKVYRNTPYLRSSRVVLTSYWNNCWNILIGYVHTTCHLRNKQKSFVLKIRMIIQVSYWQDCFVVGVLVDHHLSDFGFDLLQQCGEYFLKKKEQKPQNKLCMEGCIELVHVFIKNYQKICDQKFLRVCSALQLKQAKCRETMREKTDLNKTTWLRLFYKLTRHILVEPFLKKDWGDTVTPGGSFPYLIGVCSEKSFSKN